MIESRDIPTDKPLIDVQVGEYTVQLSDPPTDKIESYYQWRMVFLIDTPAYAPGDEDRVVPLPIRTYEWQPNYGMWKRIG